MISTDAIGQKQIPKESGLSDAALAGFIGLAVVGCTVDVALMGGMHTRKEDSVLSSLSRPNFTCI